MCPRNNTTLVKCFGRSKSTMFWKGAGGVQIDSKQREKKHRRLDPAKSCVVSPSSSIGSRPGSGLADRRDLRGPRRGPGAASLCVRGHLAKNVCQGIIHLLCIHPESDVLENLRVACVRRGITCINWTGGPSNSESQGCGGFVFLRINHTPASRGIPPTGFDVGARVAELLRV